MKEALDCNDLKEIYCKGMIEDRIIEEIDNFNREIEKELEECDESYSQNYCYLICQVEGLHEELLSLSNL